MFIESKRIIFYRRYRQQYNFKKKIIKRKLEGYGNGVFEENKEKYE